jgi:putative DNA primase/helicase
VTKPDNSKNNDPFARLKSEAGATDACSDFPKTEAGDIISPVPDDALTPYKGHKAHGEASAVWTYRDGSGGVMGYVLRFDNGDGEKVVLPLTYRRDGRGTGWRWKGWPDPRPLYGLDRLSAMPDAPVLIVEGEKAADAGRRLFPDCAVMSWQGGSNAVAKADWAPLQGRSVIILPDADEPGLKAAKGVRGALVKLGVKLASIIPLPADLPKGWDVADDFTTALTVEGLRSLIGGALNPPEDAATTTGFNSEWPARFSMSAGGLYFQPPGDDKAAQWVCGPFEVLGEARDPEGSGWAVVIRFKDRDGKEKTAILPKAKMVNGFNETRSLLADLGLRMPLKSPNMVDPLATCLNQYRSDHRIMLCGATGWAGSSFVLPADVIGKAGEDPMMFTGDPKALHFGKAGDLTTWQREVAARAIGNSRAVFCLSLALAGPLLKPLDLESGGFHIRGGSSSGKSTLAMLAGSVWGGGGPLGFAQSWRATANGLETMATGHSDTFMALDELAQLAPEEAGGAAYMLSNGQAKARLKSDGTARTRAQWRLLFLSTGEISLADHMKTSRAGGNVMAGQELRVIDLKADAGRSLGAWEDTHEFTTGAAYSDALKQAARSHYGHAGPTFVRAMVNGGVDVIAKAKAIEARFFKAALNDDDTGQIHRGACRFAIVAAAGELASELGVLPWEPDAAFGMALYMFKGWASGFGRTTAREETTVLRRVVDMISANMARFGAAGDDDWEADTKGPRAGESRSLTSLGMFGIQKVEGVSEDFYLFHSAGWSETCNGLDAAFAAKTLKHLGYLVTDSDGRLQKAKKIKGQSHKMYWVKASILSHDFGMQDG